MLHHKGCFVVPALFLLLMMAGPALAAAPIVNVKVAEYPEKLDFTCPRGATWKFGAKSGKIPAGAPCSIVGKLLVSAKITYHVMVESVPMREAEKVAQAMARWQATGRPVHTLQLGKISYAPDGKTVSYDGRVLYFGVGQSLVASPAQKLVDELAAVGSSSWILEEILQRSRGQLVLKVKGREVAGGTDELQIQPDETIHLAKVEHARGYSWHGYADRTYRGRLTIRWGARNALDGVLQTDLETILAGVVPAEISAKAALGALQAQAVAARGEILSKVGLRHANEGFDFCSEQHCQVFSGENDESRRMARMIAPTRGLLLRNPAGDIVDAVYAANCGGHSEANQLVWTSPPDPMLAGSWDTPAPLSLDLRQEDQVRAYIQTPPACYCADPTVEGGDKFRWEKTIGGPEFQAVEQKGAVGRLREVKEFTRGLSGRIYRLTLVGENGSRTLMKELAIRQLFGGLRSSCFVVSWKKDKDGFIRGATFQGAGWGHGVGMCQTGAQSMAKQGAGFEKILMHYFPGARLGRAY